MSYSHGSLCFTLGLPLFSIVILLTLFFQNIYNITGLHIEEGLIPSFVPQGYVLLEFLQFYKTNNIFKEYYKFQIFTKINIR